MSYRSRAISRNVALAATAFALLVIALGAFTRLVDAGLGCPDWPGCYGHALWPDEHHEIVAANEAYPDMPVDTAKTWPEMVHRYLATGLGIFSIVLAALAVRNRRDGGPLKLPLFLLGFIILQGMFGMWTVTLKLWPQVVTGHLLGGFITFNLFWLMVLRLSDSPKVNIEKLQRSVLLKFTVLVLGLVTLQIALGGWTTSNYAAVACPDFPMCQGQWWPEFDMKQGFNIAQGLGPNYLGGLMENEARIAIHLSHRIGAIIVLLAGLALTFMLYSKGLRCLAVMVAVALGIQILLGVSNIVFHFPVWIAVAHNLGGALLAATLVFVVYALYTANPSKSE